MASIPGDGIGPEVVEATLPLLQAAAELDGAVVEVHELDWGGGRFVATGEAMPSDALDLIRSFDAVLLGAVGRTDIPIHVPIWGVILPLRQGLDLYVNLRPVKVWEGVAVPVARAAGADFLIVRENSEGEYVGMGGRSHAGTAEELALEVAVHSRRGIERIAHYAFRAARDRRKSLTLVSKSNASRYGYVLWDDVVADVGREYPDVELEIVLVDAMTVRMVTRPQSLDVVLCSNLFGDILSDLGAGLQGSLGLAPSANIRPEGGVPGIFEPVHGSAPDIAGTGIANPIGCILSAAMLLEHLGCLDGARALEQAVGLALMDPSTHTPDIGGAATTAEAAASVRSALPGLTS